MNDARSPAGAPLFTLTLYPFPDLLYFDPQEFVHVQIHPGAVPALLCYTGTFSPLTYSPDKFYPSHKSFSQWLKKVVSIRFFNALIL